MYTKYMLFNTTIEILIIWIFHKLAKIWTIMWQALYHIFRLLPLMFLKLQFYLWSLASVQGTSNAYLRSFPRLGDRVQITVLGTVGFWERPENSAGLLAACAIPTGRGDIIIWLTWLKFCSLYILSSQPCISIYLSIYLWVFVTRLKWLGR